MWIAARNEKTKKGVANSNKQGNGQKVSSESQVRRETKPTVFKIKIDSARESKKNKKF